MKNFLTIKQMALFVLAILFATGTAMSQEKMTEEERAVKELEQIMARTNAVGLAVAVVDDGKIVFVKSLGKKDIEKNIDLVPTDIFRIASISKSFATTALMQLVETKKLSLDMDVSDLIGFRLRNPKYPDIKITVKMLLSHTSSLCDSLGYFELDLVNPEKNPGYAKAYHSYYAPGEKYDYCNLGFNIIGTLVEKLSGVRFDNYVRDNIIRPLGLYANHNVDSLDANMFVPLYSKDASGKFVSDPSAYRSRSADIANGYIMGYSTPLFSPTGGIKISAQDLAKYMIMHMNYGKSGGVRIISKKSSRLMQAPVIATSESSKYCMALLHTYNLIPGEDMVGHTGSAYGLYSAMFFDPREKFGVVMMTNGCTPVYKDGFTVIQGDVIRAMYNIFVKD